MPTYSEEKLKGFKHKDLRIHKSGIVKSYVENHGELPTEDFLEKAIDLIYSTPEWQKSIVTRLIQEESRKVSKEAMDAAAEAVPF